MRSAASFAFANAPQRSSLAWKMSVGIATSSNGGTLIQVGFDTAISLMIPSARRLPGRNDSVSCVTISLSDALAWFTTSEGSPRSLFYRGELEHHPEEELRAAKARTRRRTGVGGMGYGGTAIEKSTSAEHRSACLRANCRHDAVPAEVPTTATLPMPRTSSRAAYRSPVPGDLSPRAAGSARIRSAKRQRP